VEIIAKLADFDSQFGIQLELVGRNGTVEMGDIFWSIINTLASMDEKTIETLAN
jgi:hypothetical protein